MERSTIFHGITQYIYIYMAIFSIAMLKESLPEGFFSCWHPVASTWETVRGKFSQRLHQMQVEHQGRTLRTDAAVPRWHASHVGQRWHAKHNGSLLSHGKHGGSHANMDQYGLFLWPFCSTKKWVPYFLATCSAVPRGLAPQSHPETVDVSPTRSTRGCSRCASSVALSNASWAQREFRNQGKEGGGFWRDGFECRCRNLCTYGILWVLNKFSKFTGGLGRFWTTFCSEHPSMCPGIHCCLGW